MKSEEMALWTHMQSVNAKYDPNLSDGKRFVRNGVLIVSKVIE